MSYKWKPIISAGCILLYRWAVRPLKLLSRLKNNFSTFSMLTEWDGKQKEFNREIHRTPKKEEQKKTCVEQQQKNDLREKRKGKTEWESEKERTQKCGPPGLDADTSEGLLRGGARPYGCMAKWNPRGGSGHISLHGALPSPPLHCGLRDAQEHWQWHQALPPLWWLLDPSWHRWQKARKRKKITCSAPRAQSYLCHSIMTRGPQQKQRAPWSWEGWDWRRSPDARYRWPLSNNRGESHNSTVFHTKSATVVKSISHYL